MRHFLKKLIPILLALAILVSVGWYFLVYDTTLTRDLLLKQARRFEQDGDTSAAVWLYNLAYLQSGNDEAVAIELSEQFKAIGNYSKAESTLTKAIQDGGGVDVYVALCKLFLEQDKLYDAVTMLDKVGNKEIKAQLDTMRPKAPVASVPSGSYTQYLNVDISTEGGKLYVTTDREYPSIHADEYTAPVVLSGGNTTIYALTFAEGGNAWTEPKKFNPFEMKRSAGVGVRIFLPMVGLMGIDWAYGFDKVYGTKGGSQFHFILGQEF